VNQRFAVDLVGLRPPVPTRCRNRGGIDNMAFYSLILQHPIDPEAIEPSFLDDDQREDLPVRARLALQVKPECAFGGVRRCA
jgi:hypothetical protein